jgi:hypothetical protein
MTWRPYYNRDHFQRGATILRGQGHEVFSPWENDVEKYGLEAMNSPEGDPAHARKYGFNLDDAARIDTHAIIDRDAIAMLPDWEHSRGAFGEWGLARWLRRKFFYLSQEMLDAAH